VLLKVFILVTSLKSSSCWTF